VDMDCFTKNLNTTGSPYLMQHISKYL